MTLFLLVFLGAGIAVADEQARILEDFEAGAVPADMTQNNVTARVVEHERGRALEVQFHQADWPNVFFTPADGVWDWSDSAGLAVDIYNPEPEPVQVCVRIDNAGGNGMENCNTGSASARPGMNTLKFWFSTRGEDDSLWGMRGVPMRGPMCTGQPLDRTRITAYQIFLPKPTEAHTLVIDNIRVFGRGGKLSDLVPMPFIDQFGQYKHDDWPGKVHSADELRARSEEEAQALGRAAALSGRDRFGGWADGPQLEATGWFRTEKVDGNWWLVTPEGRLFFSLGVDCVGTWEQTFVEGRDGWFEWLPVEGDQMAAFYGRVSGAHSMADIIGGEGRTFSFYRANLYRKYGEAWAEQWRERAYARLQAWGFNTIANWSQQDVMDNSPIPFTANGGVSGDFRRIEGGGGYWGKMPDAYDPAWQAATARSLEGVAKRYGQNPLCIGYYVDNELSWEAVERGPLASPPDQPCRVACVDGLKEKYGSLDALNAAWGTNAESWDALRVPETVNAACQADLDAWVHLFARTYFETVKNALKKDAPNQLYLGCRFSTAPKEAVRACAEVADVVSFNLYRREIKAEDYRDLLRDTPGIIGEFHFGALDRGMFHTGLVPTESQEERAAAYIRYVESLADSGVFVGCHWFQYIDEPTTGRWFDGENYNIGFVNQTDTPYPELVAAAKDIHGRIYERRR